MTVEEGQKVIQQFEAEGKSKEEIAGAFYLLFRDGKIDINGLEGLVNLLGYELDEDFKNMSTEDQKQYGYEVIDDEDEGEEKTQEEEDTEEEEEENPEPQKEPEENDEEKEEKEGLSYFEGRKSNQNDDDYDEEEEKEARKLLKY